MALPKRKRNDGSERGIDDVERPARRAKRTRSTATTAEPRITRLMKRSQAINAVFNTTELLENIVVHLSPKGIFGVQRVCRKFYDVINGSNDILRKLFVRVSDTEGSLWTLDHPVGILWGHPAELRKVDDPSNLAPGSRVMKSAVLSPFFDFKKDPDYPAASRVAYGPELMHLPFSDRVRGSPSWHKTFLSDPPAKTAKIYLHWRLGKGKGAKPNGMFECTVRKESGLTFGDLMSEALSATPEEGRAFYYFLAPGEWRLSHREQADSLSDVLDELETEKAKAQIWYVY